jgi:hypothetical protein
LTATANGEGYGGRSGYALFFGILGVNHFASNMSNNVFVIGVYVTFKRPQPRSAPAAAFAAPATASIAIAAARFRRVSP